MASISSLVEGYRRFYQKYFQEEQTIYKTLSQGQSPNSLVISCSDSRVDPAILMDVDPGDIFVVRNVANLVPPYEPEFNSCHGTSAAIEFAVNHLKVENIIVIGHSSCGGIKALVDDSIDTSKEQSFIASWVKLAKKAKEKVQGEEEVYSCCEKESIANSLDNLSSFPFVKEKVDNGALDIHGWYFSINDGKLHYLDKETREFKLL